ncbi:YXWGXW repeat-containing protein [Alicycliphilus denitrificans]|uniref:YXWGXW repeat-containing protein n=1 Tax=Alicycliphilus denitrificans TaxID=179636 RepID=UPI0015FF7008|nr:YXWGXW repeat-containing protein [Alicycliphilus denitrificans]
MILTSTFTTGLRRTLPALALAAAGLALTGCVVAPAYPVGDVVYAPSAPPPLQAEMVPVAPSPVHVWINGYWGWGGGRYAWTPGYWAVPPRPGYVWHPRRWDHGPRGWQQRGGRWGPR